MICPNCGRELAEGEVCNCVPAEPEVNPVPAEEPAQEQPAYQEPVQEANAYQPPVQEAPAYQTQGTYYVPPVAPQGEFYSPNNEAPYAQPQFYQQAQKLPPRTDYPEGYKIKRKYAAVILAATLGVFGIHNFYLGESNKAIIHILVATLGSIFVGLGFVASYIWSVVEAVQLLTDDIDRDANGYKIQTIEEAIVKTRIEAEKRAD